jgi:hypothetical protein
VVCSLALWLALDASLFACPICFQVEDGPVTAGVRAAVLVLIGVTGAVLSGFAAFIVRFVRRTRSKDGLEAWRLEGLR